MFKDATKDQLKLIVQQYPYYHAARISLLQLLYQQHDTDYTDDLRRAAVYLPSRESVFNIVKEEQFRPADRRDPVLSGATIARKAVSTLKPATPAVPTERTSTLIDSFLNTLPSDPHPSAGDRRRPRSIDASQDYIGFMLQEEEDTRRQAAYEAAIQSTQQPSSPVKVLVSEQQTDSVSVPVSESTSDVPSDNLIDRFILDNGDKRIRLRDTDEGDLRRPVLTTDDNAQQGAFTEALARIYIKQGKFDHAIEIIRRLSLKYPKKNRYFADQLRFLEKIIENQRHAKG